MQSAAVAAFLVCDGTKATTASDQLRQIREGEERQHARKFVVMQARDRAASVFLTIAAPRSEHSHSSKGAENVLHWTVWL
jgi:hypothetical protein